MSVLALARSTLLVLSLAPTMSLAQDKYFDAAGARLRYVEQGAGEPVVLVHGFANTLEIWASNGIVQDLSRNYRVIAFDLRGHGKSDKPHDPARYGREMALDIVRLLDHLRIQRAHIVGYSLGGHVVSRDVRALSRHAVLCQAVRPRSLRVGGHTQTLGELYEARNEHQKAISHYTQFVELWKKADPEFQPRVAEVKQRIVREISRDVAA